MLKICKASHGRFQYSTSCVLLLLVYAGIVLFSGCSFMVSSATESLAENLSYAVLNNNDPDTVEAGAPAYLMLIAGIFVKEVPRAKKMTQKAVQYAFQAACLSSSKFCSMRKTGFDEFKAIIEGSQKSDIPVLYTVGAAWAGWIQVNRDDWNAIAEIARIEEIMKVVVEKDELHQDGGAHLFLGIAATLIPPGLGGRPEIGKMHFERALEIAGHRNLMIKVVYARQYARLLFKKELHDQLLKDVVAADGDIDGYKLVNVLAKKQAEELLKSSDEYF